MVTRVQVIVPSNFQWHSHHMTRSANGRSRPKTRLCVILLSRDGHPVNVVNYAGSNPAHREHFVWTIVICCDTGAPLTCNGKSAVERAFAKP
jgi:hypothetical protein